MEAKRVLKTGSPKPNRLGKEIFYDWDGSKYKLSQSQLGWVGLGVFITTLIAVIVLDSGSPTQPLQPLEIEFPMASTEETIRVPETVVDEPEPSPTPTESLVEATPSKTRPQKSSKRETGPAYTFLPPRLVSAQRLTIPPGTEAKAKLVSGASDGNVKAKLLKDIVVNELVLAHEGATLLGQGSSGRERLTVTFDRMVDREGKVTKLKAIAHDPEDRIAGIKGDQIGTATNQLLAGAGLNFVGALSEGLRESEVKDGVEVKKTDLGNAALHGAGYAALEQGNQFLSEAKNNKPKIEVPAETYFPVFFQ